jgi:hypothetical protein
MTDVAKIAASLSEAGIDRIIWWVGAAHLFVYGLVGTIIAVTWLTWKLHARLKLMSVILAWHLRRRDLLQAEREGGQFRRDRDG